MTISIGYVLGHIFEFLLFAYFVNTSFYPRKNYTISTILSLCGYIILFGIGILGKISVSIIAFFIVNVILLIYCYNVRLKSAIFYVIVLDMLSLLIPHPPMLPDSDSILPLKLPLPSLSTDMTSSV